MRRQGIFNVIVWATISIFLIGSIVPSAVLAQPVSTVTAGGVLLPAPGTLVAPSEPLTPPIIKGLQIDPQEPLSFTFIVDSGDAAYEESAFGTEAKKLINYFLASLTVPDEEMWVNLSPTERERIIPESFSATEMGRDLLAQDYLLKQLTASLLYPEEKTGAMLWEKIYAKAYEAYGHVDIPVETLSKVWIVPDTAVVYENGTVAFIAESHLKVLMADEYKKSQVTSDTSQADESQGRNEALPVTHETSESDRASRTTNGASQIQDSIIREIVIPIIEKEVNEGAQFSRLRQVYHSMILAAWFKRRLQASILGQGYVGKNKVTGIDLADRDAKEQIYAQYLAALKKGVYDYIKEEYDPYSQELIPRKYFSGGCDMGKQLAAKVDIRTDKSMLSGIIGMTTQDRLRKVAANITLTADGKIITPRAHDAAVIVTEKEIEDGIREAESATDLKESMRIFARVRTQMMDVLSRDPLLAPYLVEDIPNVDGMQHLATGGMAILYRSSDADEFFYKVGSTVVTEDRLAANRNNQHEARVLSQLVDVARTTGGIPELIACGLTNGGLFWMKLRGMPFSKPIIHPTRGWNMLAREQLFPTVIAAANVVAALHNAGFVHNDIKPHNFVRGPDGKVMLVDFGFATTIGSSSVAGTDDFKASETIKTERSDIFSFGSTLYFLFESFANGAYVRRDAPLGRLIAWMRMLRPEDRTPHTMAEVAEALTVIADTYRQREGGSGTGEVNASDRAMLGETDQRFNPVAVTRNGTRYTIDEVEPWDEKQVLDDWFADGKQRYFFRDRWEHGMSLPGAFLVGMRDDAGKVVGLITFNKGRSLEGGSVFHGNRMEIDDALRGSGLGEVLMAKSLEWMSRLIPEDEYADDDILLLVRPSEDGDYALEGKQSRDFFQGLGFRRYEVPGIDDLDEDAQEENLYLYLDRERAQKLWERVSGSYAIERSDFAMLGEPLVFGNDATGVFDEMHRPLDATVIDSTDMRGTSLLIRDLERLAGRFLTEKIVLVRSIIDELDINAQWRSEGGLVSKEMILYQTPDRTRTFFHARFIQAGISDENRQRLTRQWEGFSRHGIPFLVNNLRVARTDVSSVKRQRGIDFQLAGLCFFSLGELMEQTTAEVSYRDISNGRFQTDFLVDLNPLLEERAPQADLGVSDPDAEPDPAMLGSRERADAAVIAVVDAITRGAISSDTAVGLALQIATFIKEKRLAIEAVSYAVNNGHWFCHLADKGGRRWVLSYDQTSRRVVVRSRTRVTGAVHEALLPDEAWVSPVQKALQQVVDSIHQRAGVDAVKAVWIFGSYADGTWVDGASDVDLFVQMRTADRVTPALSSFVSSVTRLPVRVRGEGQVKIDPLIFYSPVDSEDFLTSAETIYVGMYRDIVDENKIGRLIKLPVRDGIVALDGSSQMEPVLERGADTAVDPAMLTRIDKTAVDRLVAEKELRLVADDGKEFIFKYRTRSEEKYSIEVYDAEVRVGYVDVMAGRIGMSFDEIERGSDVAIRVEQGVITRADVETIELAEIGWQDVFTRLRRVGLAGKIGAEVVCLLCDPAEKREALEDVFTEEEFEEVFPLLQQRYADLRYTGIGSTLMIVAMALEKYHYQRPTFSVSQGAAARDFYRSLGFTLGADNEFTVDLRTAQVPDSAIRKERAVGAPETKGGIDLNPAGLGLEVRSAGGAADRVVTMDMLTIDPFLIDGAYPVIISISSGVNLPQLLGAN